MSDAESFLETAIVKLGQFGIIRRSLATPYWKIPGYFEVFVELEPTRAADEIFAELVSALGTGWEVRQSEEGGSWAVWNPKPSASFVWPEVRWANIECFRP